MLKNTIGLSFGATAALFGAVIVLAPACTENTGNNGNCTPNQQVSCACPGDTTGVQVCNSDGTSFGECQCAGETGSGGTGGTGGNGTTKTGACGDGIPDPGECEPGEFACPADCTGTGGTGGTTTTTDTCSGVIGYAGMIADVPSAWGAKAGNGTTGYEAGVYLCQTIAADHPCDYEEILGIEMAGEVNFKAIAKGTTAWVHRTTEAMVNGMPSPPGAGGRCNDWTYTTNHISDGEYITFDEVGVPTYHLDNDTEYDDTITVNNPHVNAVDLQCGGVNRAILCCYPTCQ